MECTSMMHNVAYTVTHDIYPKNRHIVIEI